LLRWYDVAQQIQLFNNISNFNRFDKFKNRTAENPYRNDPVRGGKKTKRPALDPQLYGDVVNHADGMNETVSRTDKIKYGRTIVKRAFLGNRTRVRRTLRRVI